MSSLPSTDLKQFRKRSYVIVAIQLILAMGFIFRPGSYLPKEGYIFYQSYYADVMIPFAFYFLLSLNEKSLHFLRSWIVKAAIIFLVMTTSEVLQYFGIYAFGVTFDPMDIVAFGVGTILAVLVDIFLFPRIFSFWEVKK
jgi:hypothetical protein